MTVKDFLETMEAECKDNLLIDASIYEYGKIQQSFSEFYAQSYIGRFADCALISWSINIGDDYNPSTLYLKIQGEEKWKK